MSRSKKTPEVKVWRVGNFVLRKCEVPTFGSDEWKLGDAQVRAMVKKGEIGTVECVEVLSLDGAWCVRLMPGSLMESLLVAYMDGVENAPQKDEIEAIMTNIMAATSIGNGYFQKGITMLLAAYCDPSLVKGGGRRTRKFLKEIKVLRDGYLEWRREYEDFMESQDEDIDIDRDSTAENARQVLDE